MARRKIYYEDGTWAWEDEVPLPKTPEQVAADNAKLAASNMQLFGTATPNKAQLDEYNRKNVDPNQVQANLAESRERRTAAGMTPGYEGAEAEIERVWGKDANTSKIAPGLFHPSAFEPQFELPVAQDEQQLPSEQQFSDPQWVLDTWRKLYYNYPSAGLKQRVEEAEEWERKKRLGLI